MEKLIRIVDVPICLLDVYLLKRPRDTNVVGNVAKSWLHSRIYIVTNITCSHLHDEATRSSISRITITWCLLLHWIATGNREACTGSRSNVEQVAPGRFLD
jgi:hypothetical protein